MTEVTVIINVLEPHVTLMKAELFRSGEAWLRAHDEREVERQLQAVANGASLEEAMAGAGVHYRLIEEYEGEEMHKSIAKCTSLMTDASVWEAIPLELRTVEANTVAFLYLARSRALGGSSA